MENLKLKFSTRNADTSCAMVGRKFDRRDRGGVLVETAIFIPFALLLFSGMLTVGRLFLDMQIISRVAYEGARLAAKTNGLEVANGRSMGQSCSRVTSITYNGFGAPTAITSTSPYACTGHNLDFPSATEEHAKTHARVNFLMALNRLALDSTQPWETSVQFDAPVNKVTVSIVARSTIVGFGTITVPITATQSLTYLAN